MKIHKEGYSIIALSLILVFALYLAFHFLFNQLWLDSLIGLGGAILLIFVLQFFRDPRRFTPVHPLHIIAPADGKVVVIEETHESEYLKENRIQLSIFMSPLDVHSNRNPVSGVVTYIKYHSGKYLVAWHPKSSTENERATFAVRLNSGIEILYRQIAGAMARRIRYYVQENDQIKQGEEFGFIKFGSRLDIFLPLDIRLNVKIGDQVKAGESIIAEFDKGKN
ncbi:MAG: phosphatidylserine decarboxylase family protein [Bacteroidota bacterium]